MPIYEYLCEECGRISELMQKVSDPPPRSCPECGSRKIARLVSRTAFQLKGGGWYADLYSSTKKDAKASKASEPAASSGEKKSAAETAPASSTGDKRSGSTDKPVAKPKASTGSSGS